MSASVSICRSPSVFASLLVAVVALATIAAGDAPAEQTKAPAAPTSQVNMEVVAKGLEHPWALAFLPDGRMLITERPGRMRIVTREGKLSRPLPGVPKVAATGQGGLLDVALTPNFERSRLIYFSFSEPRDGGTNGTSVARARLAGVGSEERLEDLEVIFRQQPSHRGGLHFGSRLVFAPDGNLFVTLGERFQMRFARISDATGARSSASRRTAAPRPTIRSSDGKAPGPKSGATDIAIPKPPRSIRQRTCCGWSSMVRRAATRSISWSVAPTTAGP